MARISAGTFGAKRIFFTCFYSELPAALWVADLIRGEAEFGNHLLERNTAFRILAEVFPRGGDGLPFLFAQRFIVIGFNHDFEELQDGRELIGPELVEQLMGVLLVSGHYIFHSLRSWEPNWRLSQLAPESFPAMLSGKV
jgi:hypothetical protein